MNRRTSRLAVAAVLILALLSGCYAISSPDPATDEQQVTVSACEQLPDYDYERMVARVEEIKGMQLERNLSICVEQTTGGIDTTPESSRFARVEEPGLAFFGLDATVNSRQRSSLGHTSVSLNGGPIKILLANETVVENVSWISYEALVAHELSDALRIPGKFADNAAGNERATRPRTTDAILARQALANGVSMHVAHLYVERYGGHLNVSALNAGERNWKRRVVQSVYYAGYRYSERTGQRTVPKTSRLNSTAQILHPSETIDVTTLPDEPDLTTNALERVRTDRVGESFLRGALRSKGISFERASAAAEGWTNDRMDYYRANGSTVVTWRVRWQSADELAEFVETYDAVYDYERVDSLRTVDCERSDRYLTTSEETVTVLSCNE